MRQARLRLPYPVELGRIAAGICGATRFERSAATLWWATVTPDGVGTLRLAPSFEGLAADAWGPGADWLVAQAPALVGAEDLGADRFAPDAPLLAAQLRRVGPVRLGRTDRVADALLVGILGQKVQGAAVKRSLARLQRRHGEPAPGPAPAGLRTFPSAATLASVPSWEYHRCGVERSRADTIVRAAKVAHRLEEAAGMGADVLDRRLRAVRGIGLWTSAIVRAGACGDADAVPVGDFHIAHHVCHALTGTPRGSDERMLELLEPYRGDRLRAVNLILASGRGAPRRGQKLDFVPVDELDRPGSWHQKRSAGG